MANTQTEELCAMIGTLGGTQLAEKAAAVFQAYEIELTQFQFESLMSSLAECISLAQATEVTLPVSAYSEAFFSPAGDILSRGAEQCELGYGAAAGAVAPTVGFYWQLEPGDEQSVFYIIKIEDPEPPGLSHESLAALFTDIADAIRTVSGSTDLIMADQFPQRILALASDNTSS